MSACARFMPRRRRRSRSTPRKASTTASGARPPGTRSPSCATSRAATSSKQWNALLHEPGSPIRHDTSGQGPARPRRAQGAARRHGAGGRVLPRGAAEPAGRETRHGSTCARGATRARPCASSASAGHPRRAGRSSDAVRAPARPARQGGLAHQGQNGLRDAFRGRVIFPIFDPAGKADRAGRPDPARRRGGCRTQVPQLARDSYLLEKAHPLRPQLGQTGHRPDRRSDHLRGLHRCHRPVHCRPATGGRHLRDCAHRGAFPSSRAIREAGRPRVRRRRSRAVGCRPLLRMGEAS